MCRVFHLKREDIRNIFLIRISDGLRLLNVGGGGGGGGLVTNQEVTWIKDRYIFSWVVSTKFNI